MSLSSIQRKLNAKFAQRAKQGSVSPSISPSLNLAEREFRAYKHEIWSDYLQAKAKYTPGRQKFPGKDLF